MIRILALAAALLSPSTTLAAEPTEEQLRVADALATCHPMSLLLGHNAVKAAVAISLAEEGITLDDAVEMTTKPDEWKIGDEPSPAVALCVRLELEDLE